VPVFLADAKGDVSSLAKAGEASDKFNERLKFSMRANKIGPISEMVVRIG
jgi:hypothetical protein